MSKGIEKTILYLGYIVITVLLKNEKYIQN